jgi:hypothetical protein
MRTRPSIALILLSCVFSTACESDSLGPQGEEPLQNPPQEWDAGFLIRANEPIQTDSVRYRLVHRAPKYNAFAQAAYVNVSARSVYYARCTSVADGPTYAVVRTEPDTGFTWVAQASIWPCVGGVPAGEIQAGDSLTLQVWLGSTDSPPGVIPMYQRTGLHRVVLFLHSAPGEDLGVETLLPLEERQSNRFWIQAP